MVIYIPRRVVVYLRIPPERPEGRIALLKTEENTKGRNCALKREVLLKTWPSFMSCIHSSPLYHLFYVCDFQCEIFFMLFHYIFFSFLGDVGKLTRGDCLISRDWKRAKQLQSRAESLIKFMEHKKKEIWNFSLIKKSQEPDKVGVQANAFNFLY